jgi:ribosomal protein S5
VVLATYEALKSLRTAEQVAKLRDKTVHELFA